MTRTSDHLDFEVRWLDYNGSHTYSEIIRKRDLTDAIRWASREITRKSSSYGFHVRRAPEVD